MSSQQGRSGTADGNSATGPAPESTTRPRRGSRFIRTLAFVLAVALPVACLAWFVNETRLLLDPPRTLTETRVEPARWAGTSKVAIIRLEGTIITGEGALKKQIERVIADPGVKAVVLRINSPGGTVTGSDYLLHHLQKMRLSRGGQKIPLVVSMGSLAASGGYYVAMAVEDTPDTIYAEPTTWTGSIGVIIPHYNFGEAMQEHGIESDSIASHRLKGMGSFTRAMTDEEREIMQALVDEAFDDFKAAVASGRPKLSAEQISEAATGQVFTARQALERGLVDKLGFVEDAVIRAAELANIPESDLQVVQYSRPRSMLEFSLIGDNHSSLDVPAMLQNATTPQAYYVFSFLPGLETKGEN